MVITNIFLIVLSFNFSLSPSCRENAASTGLSSSLPFIEFEGQFITKNLLLAQKETPFTIILPSFIPGTSGVVTPEIKGLVSNYQTQGLVSVEISYYLNLGGVQQSVIQIWEYDSPITLLDPLINPGWETIKINGIEISKETNMETEPTFYFNAHNLGFKMLFINFPSYNQSIDVVRSIIVD